jgi:hypothetical protein
MLLGAAKVDSGVLSDMRKPASGVSKVSLKTCLSIVCLCTAAVAATVTCEPVVAQAQQPAEHEYVFLLGLKEAPLRTEPQARALAARLRQRLLAARLPDHRIQVNARRAEVKVEVQTSLRRELVQSLLTARGAVRIVSVSPASEDLSRLRANLPPQVTLGWEQLGDRQEVFLQSEDRSTLARFVESVSWVLPSQKLVVGPSSPSGEAEGWRTWVLAKDGLELGKAGLREVKLGDGGHPYYHYVTAWWGELTAAQSEALPEGVLGGSAGLEAMTRDSQGRRLLLMVDGHAVLALGQVPVSDKGSLMLKLPQGGPERQLNYGRQVAAMMASQAHPCPLVVVRAQTLR